MRSHVDPCMFVAFIHVPRLHLSPELLAVLHRFQPAQGAAPDAVLDLLPERSFQVRFHETYHVWQGLRLPFMHRYALLSFHKAVQAFGLLARSAPDHRGWDCLLPEFERLTLDERIECRDGTLFLAQAGARSRRKPDDAIVLRPLDLMECATSLAEYQVTATGDKSDPVTLDRWAKRNPATLQPYAFAARFLADRRLALRAMLPLINAAFHTSEPVRAFAELLLRLRRDFTSGRADTVQFLAHPEPCQWDAVFDMYLGEIPFEAPVNADGHLLGSPYHRLTLDAWVGGALHADGGSIAHPFLSVRARAWQTAQQALPELGLLMGQPAWVRPQTLHQALRQFAPMLTVYRFHVDGVNDRTLLTGPADGSGFASLTVGGAPHWRAVVADMLTLYGAVRRASGAHFDSAQRTCHHAACPHHGDNFCNMFPAVPARYTACTFPARMRALVDLHRS